MSDRQVMIIESGDHRNFENEVNHILERGGWRVLQTHRHPEIQYGYVAILVRKENIKNIASLASEDE